MPVAAQYVLTNQEELLLRQVIEIWVQEGRPTSRAFRPNSGDSGQLSADRSSMVTPREAFEAYLAKGRSSAGVWGVSIGECGVVSLSAYSDPLPDSPAHAIVDFAPIEENHWRSLSKKLHAHAVRRGRLYPASEAA